MFNLFQWSAQVALIAIAAAVVTRLVRVESPSLRHGFWRTLLVACLVLPLFQPWTPPPPASLAAAEDVVAPPITASPADGVRPSPSLLAKLRRTAVNHWPIWVGFVFAAGAAARLIWIAAGLLRLRRLATLAEAAAPAGEYEELAERIQARAEIRYAARIGQPVTFGVLSPVILLPQSFAAMSAPLQRAVLAHELWHVRRRDWAWVLAEECVRAALWFHPAIWWLVSKVQSSREEVVDELTVQLTSARKAYLEALLVFADEPTLFPAAPFARRRHLFERMLLISREAVMSSKRIVTSLVAAAAAVAGVGWYAASAFPLRAEVAPPPVVTTVAAAPAPGAAAGAVEAATKGAAAPAQNPPRDRRPGEAAPETAKELELRRAIELGGATSDQYLRLGIMQFSRGAAREADATWSMLRRSFPNDPKVLVSLAKTLVWAGRFDDAAAALEEAAALDASNAQTQQLAASFYWEKANKDKSLTPSEASEYLRAGVAAADRALAINPDYVDALVYKNIMLRMQATQESDAGRRQALMAEADALRGRAQELSRARGGAATMGAQGGVAGGVPGGVQGGVAGGVAGTMPPPPPPPPPPPDADLIVDGQQPLRIGGELKPPLKITDVKPVYPPVAYEAKVQGVVILEAVIDTQGDVVDAKVLRGVPLLDAAALEAVKQWQFAPTLMNGAPVPVIMTVTVNFRLD